MKYKILQDLLEAGIEPAIPQVKEENNAVSVLAVRINPINNNA